MKSLKLAPKSILHQSTIDWKTPKIIKPVRANIDGLFKCDIDSAECIPGINSFDSHNKPIRKVIFYLHLHLQNVKLKIVKSFIQCKICSKWQ